VKVRNGKPRNLSKYKGEGILCMSALSSQEQQKKIANDVCLKGFAS
jgi:hypothetical protein